MALGMIFYNRYAHEMQDTKRIYPPGNYHDKWKTNHLKMYLLLKMGNFQPVMLVFRGYKRDDGIHDLSFGRSNHANLYYNIG